MYKDTDTCQISINFSYETAYLEDLYRNPILFINYNQSFYLKSSKGFMVQKMNINS